MLLILRPAGNALIDLLKLTSLVSLVTLQDLTFNANVLRAETGDTLSVYLVVLIIYFALSSLISLGINLVERRVRRGVDA
jgi:polar amino acid transport system permease protein